MFLKIKFAVEHFLDDKPALRQRIRKFLPLFPALLPHNKCFYGFKHLVNNKKGLFLDVGANDGISALGFRKICPEYRIISVEANPLHQASLERLSQKLGNFEFILKGAGSRTSQLKLLVPRLNGLSYHTAASMNSDFLKDSMAQGFGPKAQKSVTFQEVVVEVIPLDQLRLSPDIIKIDTEGSDHEVLIGLQETIRRCRPFILIEYSKTLEELLSAFCRRESYSAYVYDLSKDKFVEFVLGNHYSGKHDDSRLNVFFIPLEKKHSLSVPIK